MILSGNEIVNQIKQGTIKIDPFDPQKVNPASVDLTLGDTVAIYSDLFDTTQSHLQRARYGDWVEDGTYVALNTRSDKIIDSKKKANVERFHIDPERGWILWPQTPYLMHTAEMVYTDRFVPILDGKSSIARLFVKVHETAGFGDPGFNGQYTLEVTSQLPVRVYPGMRICQIRFHKIEGEITSYQETGNYKDEDAAGPVESKAYISAFR